MVAHTYPWCLSVSRRQAGSGDGTPGWQTPAFVELAPADPSAASPRIAWGKRMKKEEGRIWEQGRAEEGEGEGEGGGREGGERWKRKKMDEVEKGKGKSRKEREYRARSTRWIPI